MSVDLKEKLTEDFNLIATFEKGRWNRNNHFSNYLLENLPANCRNVLEIGCGTGELSRAMAPRAERVTAIDLSPKMIEIAEKLSASYGNIDFQIADVLETDYPPEHFDAIVSVATFHHLPMEQVLPKLEKALKPGGRILVLDILQMKDVRDYLAGMVSLPLSAILKTFYNGLARPTREEREAWSNHGKTDRYVSFQQAGQIYSKFLDGAIVRRHLFFRYSMIWEK